MLAEAPAAGLPPGHRIAEYEIVRVLGAGGFGITCLAFDHQLDGPVAIKEYFPADVTTRGDGWRVSATAPTGRDLFAWGLERFLDEVRTIHRFRHPNVVRAHRYLEANGTAYIAWRCGPRTARGASRTGARRSVRLTLPALAIVTSMSSRASRCLLRLPISVKQSAGFDAPPHTTTLAHSPTSASGTTAAGVCRRTISKPPDGSDKQPNWASPLRSSASASRTYSAEVCPRTTKKPHAGTAEQPNRATPLPTSISRVFCGRRPDWSP